LESQEMMMSYVSRQSKNKVSKRKQLIDWANVTLFFEDSEGDLNVISEEEDLIDAAKYARAKLQHCLKCSIVDRETFALIRNEQDSSEFNRSRLWENLDTYRKEKRDKLPSKVKKLV
jgi:hypothetical protein